MPNLKTREMPIKDRDAVFSRAVEQAKAPLATIKEKAESDADNQDSAMDGYAIETIEQETSREAQSVVSSFERYGERGARETWYNVQNSHKAGLEQHAAEPTIRLKGSLAGNIRQSPHAAGKMTIKSTGNLNIRQAKKSVKTAEQASRTAIKTAENTAKAAKQTAKASKRAARAAKETTKAVITGVKATGRAIVAAAKGLVSGTGALIAAIAGGGWVAVVIIVIICLIGLVIGVIHNDVL